MVLYICPNCNKHMNRKDTYDKHMKRKNPCTPHENRINILEKKVEDLVKLVEQLILEKNK